MSRGTRLDRANWSVKQHGTGVPDGNTKGNQYLDDSTGISWTRVGLGPWEQNELGDLWTRTGTTLSPSLAGAGLSINTTENAASTIYLKTDGGINETIQISNIQGTSASAIYLLSMIGGVDITASKGIAITNATGTPSGDITITNTATAGNVSITKTGAGTTGRVDIVNVSSTDTDAIYLQALAGGTSIDAAGSITLTSTENAGSAIALTTNTGTSETIDISCIQGTSASAVQLYAGAGGLQLTASSGIALSNVAGTTTGDIALTNIAETGDISIVHSGDGINNTISLVNVETTANDAIYLNAIAGGIDINSQNLRMNSSGGVLITNQDLSNPSIGIAQIEDAAGALVEVSTSGAHSMYEGDSITISGTTNYNGVFVIVEILDASSFTITATYEINEGSGTVTVGDVFGDDGPAFIKIGAENGSDPLHLLSGHSDILIETVAAACSADIRLDSCDEITLDAIGMISLDSAYSSNFTMTANVASAQKLTISAQNYDAGGNTGTLELIASDYVNIDKTLDATGTISVGGPTSGENTTVIIGPGYVQPGSHAYVNAEAIVIGADVSTVVKIDGSNTSDLTLNITSENDGTGEGKINIEADDEVKITSGESGGTVDISAQTNVVISSGTSIDLSTGFLTINGSTGANFSGAVTNITVVDGIVTFAS